MSNKKIITIGKDKIGYGCPTYIIAEVSCNHMGSYDTAVSIIRAAALSGANAVKLQTYTADTMTIDSDKPPFRIGGEDNPELWKGKTLYALYKEAYTPWEWQKDLQTVAHSLGIELFSTPFDPSAVEFLERELNPPCYKVASYELTDDTLLIAIAQTKKPVIISNGYATLEELEHAVMLLREYGTEDIVILYCVTEYAEGPTTNGVNLSTINDIEKHFNTIVGFSDNNGGVDTPTLAVLSGATVIEKHIISSKNDASYDQRFSIDGDEFAVMVERIRAVESLDEDARSAKLKEIDPSGLWGGAPTYGPTSDLEQYNRRWRRSLFVTEDMKRGEAFTSTNVRSIRPEGGLAPKHYFEVLGKVAVVDIERGTPLMWEHIAM
ncbi:MAG: pseudaminic acid synthase [Candidatus Pacebacteria bacterium]|nr:pseudaminic acid synthase [Candidatus Paceibacterota bacterium]MBP9842568.1 pseudaminic acid synthase [Candidatus Paceibacterota bacterium]